MPNLVERTPNVRVNARMRLTLPSPGRAISGVSRRILAAIQIYLHPLAPQSWRLADEPLCVRLRGARCCGPHRRVSPSLEFRAYALKSSFFDRRERSEERRVGKECRSR